MQIYKKSESPQELDSFSLFDTKKNVLKTLKFFAPKAIYIRIKTCTFANNTKVMKTKNNNLSSRKLLVMGIFIAIGALFLIRLFSLQVLDTHYKQLADNNALRFVTQYPARGKIFDRNGN